jgi:HlyD family secretion protein
MAARRRFGNLQILQIDQDLRSEVGKELTDIRAKTSELGEVTLMPRPQISTAN